MKSVHWKDVYKYNDSNAWLYEEFSAKILLVSPSSIDYNNKRYLKVIKNI